MTAKTEHRHNDLPIPPEMDDHPVSQALSLYWDGGDPWGSAMAEGFALCDFVTFYLDAREEIPNELGYSPAAFGTANACEADEDPVYEELVRAFEYGDFTAADAFDYLPILNRFLDACKTAGRDY